MVDSSLPSEIPEFEGSLHNRKSGDRAESRRPTEAPSSHFYRRRRRLRLLLRRNQILEAKNINPLGMEVERKYSHVEKVEEAMDRIQSYRSSKYLERLFKH